MLIKRIGDVEIYEIDKNLKRCTRKEREIIINELFKNEYIGKEIHYLLNGKEINAIVNSITRRNFFAIRHGFNQKESYKEINIKHNIVFSGDFINLISNAKYNSSNKELKLGINKQHIKNNLWHTFIKDIVINYEEYRMYLNIRESENKYYIYNLRLKNIKRDARSDLRAKLAKQ